MSLLVNSGPPALLAPILALGMIFVSPLASAGIAVAGPTEPTRVESMARIAKPAHQASTVTCWQEGRQIFRSETVPSDERSQDLKANRSLPGFELFAKGKSIRLLDLKTGLCILEESHDGSNE